MPFTLSHAAAVLPALRRDGSGRGPLIASALVAGSFAPDIPYYTATVLPSTFTFGQTTHSPLGIVTVDVLIACALTSLRPLFGKPAAALLPARLSPLFTGKRHTIGPAFAAWFWISAAIGATTHVVWDSFTHHDRAGVRLLPFLDTVVAGWPLFHWVQYGSSALALASMIWFVSRLPRPARPAVPLLPPRRRLAALCLIGVVTSAVTVYRCVRWWAVYGEAASAVDLIPTALFGAGSGLAAALLLHKIAILLLPPADHAGG